MKIYVDAEIISLPTSFLIQWLETARKNLMCAFWFQNIRLALKPIYLTKGAFSIALIIKLEPARIFINF